MKTKPCMSCKYLLNGLIVLYVYILLLYVVVWVPLSKFGNGFTLSQHVAAICV